MPPSMRASGRYARLVVDDDGTVDPEVDEHNPAPPWVDAAIQWGVAGAAILALGAIGSLIIPDPPTPVVQEVAKTAAETLQPHAAALVDAADSFTKWVPFQHIQLYHVANALDRHIGGTAFTQLWDVAGSTRSITDAITGNAIVDMVRAVEATNPDAAAQASRLLLDRI